MTTQQQNLTQSEIKDLFEARQIGPAEARTLLKQFYAGIGHPNPELAADNWFRTFFPEDAVTGAPVTSPGFNLPSSGEDISAGGTTFVGGDISEGTPGPSFGDENIQRALTGFASQWQRGGIGIEDFATQVNDLLGTVSDLGNAGSDWWRGIMAQFPPNNTNVGGQPTHFTGAPSTPEAGGGDGLPTDGAGGDPNITDPLVLNPENTETREAGVPTQFAPGFETEQDFLNQEARLDLSRNPRGRSTLFDRFTASQPQFRFNSPTADRVLSNQFFPAQAQFLLDATDPTSLNAEGIPIGVATPQDFGSFLGQEGISGGFNPQDFARGIQDLPQFDNPDQNALQEGVLKFLSDEGTGRSLISQLGVGMVHPILRDAILSVLGRRFDSFLGGSPGEAPGATPLFEQFQNTGFGLPGFGQG